MIYLHCFLLTNKSKISVQDLLFFGSKTESMFSIAIFPKENVNSFRLTKLSCFWYLEKGSYKFFFAYFCIIANDCSLQVIFCIFLYNCKWLQLFCCFNKAIPFVSIIFPFFQASSLMIMLFQKKKHQTKKTIRSSC